ncbi:MAG: tetratricopeptide repeat protein [bacterium]|nr:tetratricopeptide repeat protein [bacterium]
MNNPKIHILLFPLLLALTLASGITLSASVSQDRFDAGNALYEEGKYAEALAVYHEIEKNGVHWKLFYNTANCYYKLNNFIKAKIYYLRAQRLKPFEPSIEKSIGIIDKRFSDKIGEEKFDFLTMVALKIENFVPLNVVSILLLLVVILLNGFIFLLLKNGKSRGLLYGVSFSLVIVLLTAGYHIYRTGKLNVRDTAVIVKADSQLHSGPGEQNTILFKVNPGLKVKIIDSSRNWLQVSASSRIAGWIEEKHLERI